MPAVAQISMTRKAIRRVAMAKSKIKQEIIMPVVAQISITRNKIVLYRSGEQV